MTIKLWALFWGKTNIYIKDENGLIKLFSSEKRAKSARARIWWDYNSNIKNKITELRVNKLNSVKVKIIKD